MKAKLLFLVSVLLLASATSVAGPLQKARSTQVVLSTVEQGNLCGGTAVGRHTILTADHCVLAAEGEMLVDGQRADLKVIARDGKDHVLLSTKLSLPNVAKIGAPPLVGDDVFLFGPAHGLAPVLLRRGYYSGRASDQSGQTWNLFDLEIINGDSGSAIFNSKGEIIGTLSIILSLGDARWRMAGTMPYAFSKQDMGKIK